MESQNWIYVSHETMAAAELAHRINHWRHNVEVCNTVDPAVQYPFPCENVPPSFQTRPPNSRRRKPYARPPDSPRHQLVAQMGDFSDVRDAQAMAFLESDTCQVRGVTEVSRRMVVDNNCGMSSFSINESARYGLPHPERNPLIAYHPDVIKEEYCRLAFLFEKLGTERRREESRWLQTESKDAMANVMELGSNMQRVVNAAHYVIEYSQMRGWDIGFTTQGGAQPPPMARVPSRVRELVCSSDMLNNRDSMEWHLYPAA